MKDAIDSHQHFWQYHPAKQDWISDEMAVIRKDFLPADLAPLLRENGISGCVAVQADQAEEETTFLLTLAETDLFIKGVVGWVNLQGEAIQERLQYFSHFPKLKGFRHVLQGEAPEYMLQPDFLRGIAALEPFGYSYDILIFPTHIPATIELVKRFPGQRFVVDHLAKPYIKKRLINEWKKDITALAGYANVYCKISGLVTEADTNNWKQEDLIPYLDTAVEAFGTERLMYGSDWPVCLVAASYSQTIKSIQTYFASYSEEEQHLIFSDNAKAFYRLD